MNFLEQEANQFMVNEAIVVYLINTPS